MEKRLTFHQQLAVDALAATFTHILTVFFLALFFLRTMWHDE